MLNNNNYESDILKVRGAGQGRGGLPRTFSVTPMTAFSDSHHHCLSAPCWSMSVSPYSKHQVCPLCLNATTPQQLLPWLDSRSPCRGSVGWARTAGPGGAGPSYWLSSFPTAPSPCQEASPALRISVCTSVPRQGLNFTPFRAASPIGLRPSHLHARP